MGELSIRRNRSFVPQYQEVSRAGKAASAGKTGKVSSPAASAAPEPLGRTAGSQAEGAYRTSRRTLQTGEAVLSEVQDKLSRIADLAREAGRGGQADRGALQKELEQLREEVDRILGGALAGETPLFPDGSDGADTLLYALTGKMPLGEGTGQALPGWLTSVLSQGDMSPEQLLAALGLDKSAGGQEILAALAGGSLDSRPAAGYLASLYLGAAIVNSASPQSVDSRGALAGLQQLLERITAGLTPDQAIAELTGGAFTSLADFESQFIGGTAPGLEAFLVNLLMADGGLLLPMDSSLLEVLEGLEGANLELLMSLLTASESTEATPGANPNLPDLAPEGPADTPAPETAEVPSASVLQAGSLEVTGQDLSGVSFDASSGVLTVGGTADVTIRGVEQTAQTILITGSGTVTVENVNAAQVVVDTAAAHLVSAGENLLGALQLKAGASLTLDGGGLLHIHTLQADRTNTLRVVSGAVLLAEENSRALGTLSIPVVIDGPASLAAQASNVRTASGKPLDAFDLLWNALLPGWRSLTAMELDGRHTKLSLLNGSQSGFLRLWLEKGDPSSHGYPFHSLTLRGRDKDGYPRTRYAYLHWNQQRGAFEAGSMFPNPFTVTGGEENKDWVYEEETCTLRILSAQVTAIAGGSGTDAQQAPFSGRIALADGIGGMELSLGGVVCRVSSGRAFDLGRANSVVLLLQRGSVNHFASGAGFAGISLGEGTSLRVDLAAAHSGDRNPEGALIASGGIGGAGIGRDRGGGRDQTSQILILGGVITAAGIGGGAGIGAGKYGAMGAVTILGGKVTSTGGAGGGAGIGGALGAAVGDISIRGGTVSAAAAHHAAAIGAGVQGTCGNITITSAVRLLKAQGGNPGADIGACLFGDCGDISVDQGADLGDARLWKPPVLPLPTAAESFVPPQFRISSRTLRLDRLLLSTREGAQAAKAVIDADRRLLSRVQEAYRALYHQVERSFASLSGDLLPDAEAPVRDTAAASTLLEDMRRSIPLPSSQAIETHNRQAGGNARRLLQ